jgi:protein O-mannosyl-transferase
LFWFLALYGYVRYAQSPTRGRYDLMVGVSFCLGLMSKPMLVTLPFTLLLFDIWPLRRARWPAIIWEKLPLFTLSAISAVVTYFVQGSAGVLVSIPPATRIANAFISYCTYIRQMFLPVRLSVFYPYPHLIPAWKEWVAIAVILGVSALVILAWRTRPYLAVGWFWYLGTMVPVVGLVQAGMQAHADRYMYVPMVGLLMMLGWGGAELASKWPSAKPTIGALAVVSCVACLVLAWNEIAYWQNDQTLFERAIEVTQDNWVAENDLGTYLYRQGQNADAIRHFENVLRVEPNYVAAHNNLGAALLELEGCPSAVPHFEKALQIDPNFVDADNNLGKCALMSENYVAAIPYLQAVVRAEPDRPEGHTGLGLAYSNIPGHVSDAIREFETASLLTPGDPRIHVSLANLLAGSGRTQEAILQLEAAQFIRPDPAVSKILDRLRSESR